LRLVLLIFLLSVASAQPPSTTYKIDTFAGTTFAGDGRRAVESFLAQPEGLAVDRTGTVYIADAADHRVRRITPAGIIETIAGLGSPGLTGDGGPASAARLNSPYGICLDSAGNLFVADLGNAVIRRIDGITGKIDTVAGGGEAELGSTATSVAARKLRLRQPRDVAVDGNGRLYISDFAAHRIYQVSTDGMATVFAGTGVPGPVAEGAAAIATPLAYPAGLAVDSMGAVFVADSGNGRLRRIIGGFIFTMRDSTGKPVEFGTPTSIAVDFTGKLYIGDGGTRITTLSPIGELSSVALSGTSVAVDVFARVYSVSQRQVYRLQGFGLQHIAGAPNGDGDGKAAAEWRFRGPSGIVRDRSGNIFIAESAAGRVRRIDPNGTLSTVTAEFKSVSAIALDSYGRPHVADAESGTISRIDSGSVQLISRGTTGLPFKRPSALVFDRDDNLFIADTGNGLIRKIAKDGTHSIAAGGGGYTTDGGAAFIKLEEPSGLAVDASGTLWFTEAGSGRIRSLAAGQVSTLADTDLRTPRGLKIGRDGDLYVADVGRHRIVRITPGKGWTPIAGSTDRGVSGDGGPALEAGLDSPVDLLLNEDGTILVAESGSGRIRRLTPDKTETNPATPPTPSTPVEPPVAAVQQIKIMHLGTAQEQPVAPGQLVSIAGSGLSGVDRLTFGGTNARLLTVEATQIVAQVPPGLQGAISEVFLMVGDQLRGKGSVTIVPSAPAVLTAKNGGGQALAVNEDGTLNSAANPAIRGSVLTLYVTGEGALAREVTANVGVYEGELLYAGLAPSLVGLYQVNVRTPAGFAPAGIQPLVIKINGVSTQSGVTIAVR
jgi:uncharacterized protein (TIGR03437 family)